MCTDLQTFIQKPSVSAQNIGLEECAEFVKDQMHKDGLPADLHEIPGGPTTGFWTSEIFSIKENIILLLTL